MYTQKHNLIKGVPQLENKSIKCATCLYKKQARYSFPQTTWRATHKLQLVHIDVRGPQRTASLNGSRYYIIFIDDYSRFCWIFFKNSNLKLLMYSGSIKHGWKTKVDVGSRHYSLTMKRNIPMEDFNNSVMHPILNTNLQHLTLHRRMV